MAVCGTGSAKAGASSPPQNIRLTGAVSVHLIGNPPPPPGWSLILADMASRQVGWAVGEPPYSPAPSQVEVLRTSDGGRQFAHAFNAPQRVLAISAPDVNRAYFLESDCLGPCTTRLQVAGSAGHAPATIWQATGVAASSASFPTAQVGFIALVRSKYGNPGRAELYATHDGGVRFTPLPLPCDGSVYVDVVHFLSAQDGWVVCVGEPTPQNAEPTKSLFRTTDGGHHWTEVASASLHGNLGALPGAGTVTNLDFRSSNVGYVAVAGYGVLKTMNTGRTWSRVFSSEVPRNPNDVGAPISVGFLPGGYGWLLSANGPPLYLTADGGETWHAGYATPSSPAVISTLGEGTAFAVLGSPYPSPQLLESHDYGAHWSRVSTLHFLPTSLQALTARDLVAAGGREVAQSFDGGQHWSAVALPNGWTAMDVGWSAPSAGWVVAERGDGSSGLFTCTRHRCSQLRSPFDPMAGTETGPKSGFALGVGTKGQVELYTTTDGGTTWTEHLLPKSFQLGGNTFPYTGADARGAIRWVYWNYGMLLSRNGGTTWTELKIPSYIYVSSLSFADPSSHGLLVTSTTWGLSMWETSDGGTSYQLLH